NQLSTDFNTRFVPQTESYAEQAFWSQYSVQTDEPLHSGTTIVEVPKELPKVNMYLIDEVSEVQESFKQMEMAVEQNCAAKSEFQSKMESVLKENDCLLNHALGVDIVNIVAQIQVKDTVIAKLKEKIKSLRADDKERKVETEVEELETQNLELVNKVDVIPLIPKLRKNRTAHIDYLKHTLEEAVTLRELVESERVLSP
nr:hypothetical protein [Tanacetum cinerariifolium]